MIWESWPWKRDLARRAASLQRRAEQRRWPEASLQKVEQDVFLVAYSIRKLADSGKLSDELEATTVSVTAHPKRDKAVDAFNWHKIDELYGLDAASSRTLSLREFCNQIIHSFVFLPVFSEAGTLDGFFVASDRAKEQQLFSVALADIVSLSSQVAEDDIVTLEARRSAVGAPLRVTRKSSNLAGPEGDAC